MPARIARPEDVPAVLALWLRFMADLGVEPPPDESHITFWEQRMRSQIESGLIFVAEEAGTLIGFLGCLDSVLSPPTPTEGF